MQYKPITLKQYLKDGNPLLTNDYGIFSIPILTTRIKNKYGRRLIRWDIDIDEVADNAQNAVDMYANYLSEIFKFPEEYKIINPLHEESSRTMTYKKTGEGEEDTNETKDTTTSGTINQTGSTGENGSFTDNLTHGEKIVREGTDTKTITGETDTTDNLEVNQTVENTETGNSTTTNSETVDGTTSGTKEGTTLNNVSAYNQTQEYAPREQIISNDTTSGTSHEEKTGESENNSSLTGQENTYRTEKRTGKDTNNRTEEGTTGGTDTHSGTDKREGTNEKIGTSKVDTTKSETGKITGVINVKNNNTENYDMTENTTKDGHVKYEEIINTLENLFSPYDWLAEKIVKAICEVFYV